MPRMKRKAAIEHTRRRIAEREGLAAIDASLGGNVGTADPAAKPARKPARKPKAKAKAKK